MLQFCFICLIKCFFYYDLSYQVFFFIIICLIKCFLLLSVLSSVFFLLLSVLSSVFIIIITAPLKIEPYKNTVRFFLDKLRTCLTKFRKRCYILRVAVLTSDWY